MNIIEKLTKRIQDRKVEVEDTNAATWQEYRDLIQHEGELPGPELDRLAGLMEQLNIDDPKEVEFHRAVIEKFEKAKTKHETEAPKLLAESRKLEGEIEKQKNQLVLLAQKIQGMERKRGEMVGQWHQASGYGEQAANLKALFPGLIDSPSLPVRLDDRIGPDADLVELRQRLGLPPIESKLGRDLQPGKVTRSMRPITFDKR